MSSPTISVVIPCYNYGRFLSRAIDSVLNQTYQDFEILIVDDCSTDETPDVGRTYSEKDDRITYICNEKTLKQSANRNVGIRQSRGKFIAMLDADDWLHEFAFDEMVDEFEDPIVGVVYTTKQLIDRDLNYIKEEPYKFPTPSGFILDELFITNFIGTAVIFRKSALPHELYDISFNPEFDNMGADWWILLEMSISWKIIGLDRLLYFTYLHGNQISSNLDARIRSDKILQDQFLIKYPNVLTPSQKKHAEYISYIKEAFYLRELGRKWESVTCLIRAMSCKPLNLKPYKALAFTILRG